MAKKHTPDRSPVIKVFGSISEIDRSVSKLKRRRDDFEKLKGLRFNDQRITNVESNFRDCVLEVYGIDSPEYKRFQHHEVWNRMMQLANYPPAYFQQAFINGLPETLKVVDGLLDNLEEKRLDFDNSTSTSENVLQFNIDLHPTISSACMRYVRDGYFDIAVLEASKALVNMVKSKIPGTKGDGTELMFASFHAKDIKNAPIKLTAMSNETEINEQRGLGHLFVGVVMAMRNPRAHDSRTDSKEDALEYLGTINMLAKKLDLAKI